jgi:excisionase family DNA binding protein
VAGTRTGRTDKAGDSTTQLAPRPPDATLTVTKAAHLLGVHPNTVRAWSNQGRLRFYRINLRGDRRYRLGDLQRFLAAAEQPTPSSSRGRADGPARPIPSIGAQLIELRTRPGERPTAGGGAFDAGGPPRADRSVGLATAAGPEVETLLFDPPRPFPLDIERRLVEVDLLGRLADLIASGRSLVEIATRPSLRAARGPTG